jgi:4a-hydroxytetrahydrobiopterin dehydratase
MSEDNKKIKEQLHKDWDVKKTALTRTFKFNDFVHAMQFVNTVAAVSEEFNHHPIINVAYNIVKLELTTKDTNSVTIKDSVLATKIDTLV